MNGAMPLDDVRVLDLTRYTAGPFCTRILADYGADVVKIERPGRGDPARSLPPFYKDQPGLERSGLFLFLNTNKRSVTVDLRTERGRALVLRAARDADVLVENFRPGTMARLGLDYARLHEANPRIVLTSITNFGQSGPYRDFEGTDLTLYAMGGPMSSSGDAEHEPLKTAGRMAGYHAGYVAALATTLGIMAAEQRGRGEHLDVAIFETALHASDGRLARLLGYQYNGHTTTRPTRVRGVANGTFPCKDGYFMLSAVPSILPAVMRMIGCEELLARPEWATVEARSHPDRVEEFMAYLLPLMLERTKEEARLACHEGGVFGAPLNTVADLLKDPQFEARRYFQEIDHPVTGPLHYPGYHFVLHRPGAPMPERRRAPLLGEHTEEVLGGELGVGSGELERMRAAAVI